MVNTETNTILKYGALILIYFSVKYFALYFHIPNK